MKRMMTKETTNSSRTMTRKMVRTKTVTRRRATRRREKMMDCLHRF